MAAVDPPNDETVGGIMGRAGAPAIGLKGAVAPVGGVAPLSWGVAPFSGGMGIFRGGAALGAPPGIDWPGDGVWPPGPSIGIISKNVLQGIIKN